MGRFGKAVVITIVLLFLWFFSSTLIGPPCKEFCYYGGPPNAVGVPSILVNGIGLVLILVLMIEIVYFGYKKFKWKMKK